MSTRKEEIHIYALDKEGKQHDISYIYTYAGGGYHQVTCFGNKEYSVEADGTGDCTEQGSYLPTLYISDLESYFSESLTKAMRLAAQEANIGDCNIQNFVCCDTVFAGDSPYTTSVTIVSKVGKIEKTFPFADPQKITEYIKDTIKSE